MIGEGMAAICLGAMSKNVGRANATISHMCSFCDSRLIQSTLARNIVCSGLSHGQDQLTPKKDTIHVKGCQSVLVLNGLIRPVPPMSEEYRLPSESFRLVIESN